MCVFRKRKPLACICKLLNTKLQFSMLLLNFQISYNSLVQLWLKQWSFMFSLCWKSLLHRHTNITFLTH